MRETEQLPRSVLCYILQQLKDCYVIACTQRGASFPVLLVQTSSLAHFEIRRIFLFPKTTTIRLKDVKLDVCTKLTFEHEGTALNLGTRLDCEGRKGPEVCF